MSIVGLILLIALVGVIVWAVTNLVPMDAAFKKLIVVVAVVAMAFYVLAAFGFFAELPALPQVGRHLR